MTEVMLVAELVFDVKSLSAGWVWVGFRKGGSADSASWTRAVPKWRGCAGGVDTPGRTRD